MNTRMDCERRFDQFTASEFEYFVYSYLYSVWCSLSPGYAWARIYALTSGHWHWQRSALSTGVKNVLILDGNRHRLHKNYTSTGSLSPPSNSH